jgi:hypothetical protein
MELHKGLHTSMIREKIQMISFTPSSQHDISHDWKRRKKKKHGRTWVVLTWGFERQDEPSGHDRCKASLFLFFFLYSYFLFSSLMHT